MSILGRTTVSQVVVSTFPLASIISERTAYVHSKTGSGQESQVSEILATAHIVKYERPKLTTAYAEPPTDLEKIICDMWQELLGIEGIGIDDDFFGLDGHSLMALQVTSRLREGLIADLSVATVMEVPTIAGLAELILEQLQAMDDDDKASEMLQQIRKISPAEKEKLLAKARKAQNFAK